MNEANSILVPVDFSVHSRAAAERAFGLGKMFGVRIHFLHALYLPAFDGDFAFSQSVWDDSREFYAKQLDSLRMEYENRGLSLSASLIERDPSDAIYAAGRAKGVEFIAMGSHGRRGLDRFLLGSVTERTLHAALVPVLVVRESVAEAREPVRKILFATDFSENAMRAERVVANFAARLEIDVEVEVVHAIREKSVLFAPYAVSGSTDYEAEIEGEMKEAARRRMQGCLERLRSQGVCAKSKIVYGSAPEEILKRAEMIGTQLIAMGTRGYSGLQRFKMGSVVQRVLRHAPCNVLVAGSGPVEANPGLLDDANRT